ncbi:MAG: ABC transporter permease [Candidatus Rokuibacteriota bacterium]|nr:MAG: ABC transporter permease [Candidatus Rokubacteria bacterium]PYN19789.1 MAG: ABC transporter permease [Candidatus Rokubacteria bacterium]
MSWRADLLAVWAVVVRNALMASRNVFFFFELLFWPIVGVVSIGLMTKFLGITPAQASFVLIGTIALSVVNVCQLEVAYAVLMDVWSKSIKHQFLAPIGIRHLTVGSWVVGMVRGSLLFTLLAVLAWWAFDFRVLAAGGGAVGLFLFGCFLNAWIVGVFVCALITLFGNRAEAFAWASVNLVLVLAGIYYPVSVLPEPAATLARAIPLTYFLDAYRSHFGFASEFAAPIATGLALSVVYAVVAHLAFYASVQRARRTGLLLKMSE